MNGFCCYLVIVFSFRLQNIISTVAVRNRGRIAHDGNSGIYPFGCVSVGIWEPWNDILINSDVA